MLRLGPINRLSIDFHNFGGLSEQESVINSLLSEKYANKQSSLDEYTTMQYIDGT